MQQLAKSSNKPKLDSSFSFEAIGTNWRIDFYEPLSTFKLKQAKTKISKRVEEFDVTYSRFRPDSMVSKIAESYGEFTLPKDADELITFYKKLYELTSGEVTPLIGQALVDAGYDSIYSLQPKNIKAVPDWEDVMTYESSVLKTSQPVLLDFGAAGKGYLVDIVSCIIESFGISHYCVDASGDLRYRNDAQGMMVGLESPDDSKLAIGTVDLKDRSLCGSAINRRQWSKYNHIFSPKTLDSVKKIKAVWVLADSTMVADGLATALFFAQPSDLSTQFSFEFVRLYSDNTAEISNNFPGELFGDN